MIELPIDVHLPAITALVKKGPGLVLSAEPGAGKTTRVPRALLLAGLAERGEIVVLEPRRIATRMAAERVAEELGEKVGQRVGYTVRFEDVSSSRTQLRFVTEGVLTRKLASDPSLSGVSVVVIDELHERSLHADLALGLLRKLQREKRPELRIVAMSATLEASRVATFLGAEVQEVEGRRFEVSIEHLPVPDERPLEVQVANAVKRMLREEPDGHVLVFLPGAGEIRRALQALEGLASAGAVEVLPLHGELPSAEQDRAVRPSKKRKVILATNVAETSLTIDGVVAVIDSGLFRQARHSPWSGLPELLTVKTSRSSAVQRAGRAGRTRKGRCLRLYTQHDQDARPLHEAPEIQRADLSELVLTLARAGIDDVAAFPFFETPPKAALDHAHALLRILSAIDEKGAITALGERLSSLPIHPRLGRVAIAAEAQGFPERGALMSSLLMEREILLSARTQFGGSGGPRGLHGGPSAHVETGPSDVLDRLERLESVDGAGASAMRSEGLDVAAATAALRGRDGVVRALLRSRPRGLSVPNGDDPDVAMQRALLFGYADRVAKRRKKGSSDVVFSGGGSAKLADTSVVRDAEFVVVVDAGERRGQIEARLSSAIEPEWLLEDFPSRITEVQEIRFDRDKQRIEKVSALAYDGLLLDESRSDAVGAARRGRGAGQGGPRRGPPSLRGSRCAQAARAAPPHRQEDRSGAARAGRGARPFRPVLGRRRAPLAHRARERRGDGSLARGSPAWVALAESLAPRPRAPRSARAKARAHHVRGRSRSLARVPSPGLLRAEAGPHRGGRAHRASSSLAQPPRGAGDDGPQRLLGAALPDREEGADAEVSAPPLARRSAHGRSGSTSEAQVMVDAVVALRSGRIEYHPRP
jgi:ATP-dependent helicase HrpB